MTKKQPMPAIAVLNPQIPLPKFAFFQVVQVKTTGEVATVVGIWRSVRDDDDSQWLYKLEGLTQLSASWWQANQLRNLRRR
jgi:hypothetical protein